MIKPLLMACLLASMSFFVNAQEQNIEMSAPFPEPNSLESKVLQCSNGNTFLFNFRKFGLDFHLYGSDRKLIKRDNILGRVWHASLENDSYVEGMYEMNNKLVLFVVQDLALAPTLFRVSLNMETGAILDEQKIAALPKKSNSLFVKVFTGQGKISVMKDPASNHYAVLLFDHFAKETNKRLELVMFDDDKEIKRIYYTPIDEKFTYVDYITMCVSGTKVFLCTNDFNTRSKGGKESQIVVSEINASDDHFTQHRIDIETKKLKNMAGNLVYLSQQKVLNLFLYENADREKGFDNYAMQITSINSENFSIVSNKPIVQDALTAYSKEQYKDKGVYVGTPRHYIVHPDNSVTVLLEEAAVITQTYHGTNGSLKQGTSFYQLYDIGILHQDKNGLINNVSVIRKCQRTFDKVLEMNLSDKDKNSVTFQRQVLRLNDYANNGFYSYDYIQAKSGDCIIFNDNEKNFGVSITDKIDCIAAISDASTVCYKLVKGHWEKDYLWGAPNNRFDNRFTLIGSAHYMPATSTYAALIIQQKGKQKLAYIAWTKI